MTEREKRQMDRLISLARKRIVDMLARDEHRRHFVSTLQAMVRSPEESAQHDVRALARALSQFRRQRADDLQIEIYFSEPAGDEGQYEGLLRCLLADEDLIAQEILLECVGGSREWDGILHPAEVQQFEELDRRAARSARNG